MPTYEYACSDCKRRFDVVQSFSDAPLTTCEVCGGTLKRVFHPVGIVLKGSGFYATDNRSSKSLSPGGKPDTTSETTSGSKSETKKGDASTSSSEKKKKSSDPGTSGAAAS